ncbi:hypothetical protein [Streptomyces sp. NBC_00425]|uniref:hypothetical protein n=1 Tax=Streptomyces sp. NBC_00425 TaxID=2975740 RepID=UPI002E1EB503
MRYLAQIDLDAAALEERWGSPDTVRDDLAEWVCFAFTPAEGEAFFLQRELHHPPSNGFVLSVSEGLFCGDTVHGIVAALGIAGAQVTHVNAEATP